MIKFTSLFLGLIVGLHPVELTVAGPVAAVEVLLDGEPIYSGDGELVPLPAYDPAIPHILMAELRFSVDEVSRLEAAFGGQMGVELRTELTAVTVRLTGRRHLPPMGDMQTWFQRGERPVPVVAVEKGPAEVIVVGDPDAQQVLEHLARYFAKAKRKRPVNRAMATIGGSGWYRYVSTIAAPLSKASSESRIFPYSQALPFDESDGFLGMISSAGTVRHPRAVADAVATAGCAAHAGQHRRAVVLLVGRGTDDTSQYPVADVRRYLELLQVPLFVWSTLPESPAPEWGESVAVGRLTDPDQPWDPTSERNAVERLDFAVRDLERCLDRQRIVWLEGRHLPQDIRLSEDAESELTLLTTAMASPP
jgi:hypothetical protein